MNLQVLVKMKVIQEVVVMMIMMEKKAVVLQIVIDKLYIYIYIYIYVDKFLIYCIYINIYL